MPELTAYTQAEAARRAGVTRQRIHALLQAGELGTIRMPGGREYVAGSSLSRYIAARDAAKAATSAPRSDK